MIDFCAQHNIVSDIEIVRIQSVNKAYDGLLKNDVKYRLVVDMVSLKEQVAPWRRREACLHRC